MLLNAKNKDYPQRNELICRNSHCRIENCPGQRLFCAGMSDKQMYVAN